MTLTSSQSGEWEQKCNQERLRRGGGDSKHRLPFQEVLLERGAENRAIAGEDAELKKGFHLSVGDTRECLHPDGKKTLGLEG